MQVFNQENNIDGIEIDVPTATVPGLREHWPELRRQLHAQKVALPSGAVVADAEALAAIMACPYTPGAEWVMQVQSFKGRLFLSLQDGSAENGPCQALTPALEHALAGQSPSTCASSPAMGEVCVTSRTLQVGGAHEVLWVLDRVPFTRPGQAAGLPSYMQVCPALATQGTASDALSKGEAIRLYCRHFLGGAGSVAVVRCATGGGRCKVSGVFVESPERVATQGAWSRTACLSWLCSTLQWLRGITAAHADAHGGCTLLLRWHGARGLDATFSAGSAPGSGGDPAAFCPPLVPPLDIASLLSKRTLSAPLPFSLASAAVRGGHQASTASAAAGSGAGRRRMPKSLMYDRWDEPEFAGAGVQGQRLAILVPFRDQPAQNRGAQLAEFVRHMPEFIEKHVRPRPAQWRIFIIEQSQDGHKFNRGKLLNVGAYLAAAGGSLSEYIGKEVDVATGSSPALQTSNAAGAFNALCLHDVDLLPDARLGPWYACWHKSMPVHIADVWDRYASLGNVYVGGVLNMPLESFQACNGFPNVFWGWGGEDDALSTRMRAKGVEVIKLPDTLAGSLTDLEDRMIAASGGERAGTKLSENGRPEWVNMTKKELLMLERPSVRGQEQKWSTWDGMASLNFKVQAVADMAPGVTRITVDLLADKDPFAAKEVREALKQYTGAAAQKIQHIKGLRQEEAAPPQAKRPRKDTGP